MFDSGDDFVLFICYLCALLGKAELDKSNESCNEIEQVNISLWPRFKMIFDMHLGSLRNAHVKTLWEDDVHPHYVMRRYAEFTASLIQLNVDYGDGQVRKYTITS